MARFIARGDEEEIEVLVERHGRGYRVKLGDRWVEVDLVKAGPFVQSLRLEDGTQYSLLAHREDNRHHVSLAGSTVDIEIFDPLARRRRGGGDDMGATGIVKALMPGRVVRILVNKGDEVKKGAGLLILEAMKMENEIQAPADGVVDEIFVDAGQTVESGADLVHVTS
jgi:biotin carboxyl carrier protein